MNPPLKRLFLRTFVASLTATAGLAILTLLFAEFNHTSERILATTALLGFFSLLSLPGGILLDQERHTPLAWTLMLLAGASFLLAMTLVWDTWADSDEAVWRFLAVLVVFAGACSQAAALTGRRRPDDSDAIARLYVFACAAAFLVATMASVAAWKKIEDPGFYRLLGAIAVADLLAALLQPVLRRMNPEPAPGQTKLVLSLDRRPSEEAVAAALEALAPFGARVERP